jgi:hypothetical protein
MTTIMTLLIITCGSKYTLPLAYNDVIKFVGLMLLMKCEVS